MTSLPPQPPSQSSGESPSSERAPSPEKTLRLLFLTLFLRGRTSRGLQKKEHAPTTIGRKLLLTLGFYFLLGFMVLLLNNQPVFAQSVYLHSLTFAFLGMFLASSAGEILFNKEEADILLHRPISPRALLWAKIRVLLQVSLWIAGAFNLPSLFFRFGSAAGGWPFILAHVVSVGLEAMFCAGCVVMVYQLCLRWFGRERLDGLITTAQVILSVGAVLCSQILPQLVIRLERDDAIGAGAWGMVLLPPAWFAGIDDAIAGTGELGAWGLTVLSALTTAFVMWMAFGKLAGDYESGLQKLNETISTSKRTSGEAGRRWLENLIDLPPLGWWLRDPVERASFLLTAAYLLRDRDVKLRVYPAIAPFMALPVVFLFQGVGRERGELGGFGLVFGGSYLAIVPMMGLSLVQYSQQWQASDMFRAAPLPGPAALCHGARRAVLFVLALPTLVVFGLVTFAVRLDVAQLLLLLPGAVAMPVFALIPGLTGGGVPLSCPTEEAKGASRGLAMMGINFLSLGLAAVSYWSWSAGWFHWFLLVEALVAVGLYVVMRSGFSRLCWPSME